MAGNGGYFLTLSVGVVNNAIDVVTSATVDDSLLINIYTIYIHYTKRIKNLHGLHDALTRYDSR